MHTSHAELRRGRQAGPAADLPQPAADDGPATRSTSGTADGGPSLAQDDVEDDAAELRRELGALRRVLVTLPAIEQAKGVLIGFYAIDADAAFALLVRWSQHTNIKLHRLASDLVTAANDSSGSPHAALRRFIDRLPGAGRPSPAAPGSRAAADAPSSLPAVR
ncbi:ANTAR domain-containing protein [Friedmanniella luteola]|uniref:ANTAR domain-containing protein n=1 Tax=Friedmanniella luteola TaxID=546871 RepID=A0A1H1RQU9_9ACTN|nr:ANTAR domain-containing protein [Friedmanniella luteola]SDS37409.1 ANTAR domain-containing protein [Friedmanniella luteola]